MTLDDITGKLGGSEGWQQTTLPEHTDAQTPANIRKTVSTILRMQREKDYEMEIRQATQQNMPEAAFRLVESLYESLMKIDGRKILSSAGPLINAATEQRGVTEYDGDDMEVHQIREAIPELIEEGFLRAIPETAKAAPAAER